MSFFIRMKGAIIKGCHFTNKKHRIVSMAAWGLGDSASKNIAPKPWIYVRKEVWYASVFWGAGYFITIYKNKDQLNWGELGGGGVL